MPDSFDALNRSSLRAFGVPVTYQQGAAAQFQITGILQKDSDEERHQDAVYARVFVRLADFPARPDHGDEAVIAGVKYTVYEVAVDPTGGASLRLRMHS